MFSILLVLLIVLAAALGLYRVQRNRQRDRRREAQRVKRAEHERIWQEQVGDTVAPVDRD